MKTETLDQQPLERGQFVRPTSPSLATLLNTPNPADTALVPSGSMAPTSSQDQHVPGSPFNSVNSAFHPSIQEPSSRPPDCFNSTIHPLIQSSNNPSLAKKPRNGKIARLPKPVRDVVNQMLFNHVPQDNIVDALDEIGFKVTQRNISNWKTRGGYREWCLAQEYAIQLHNHQDNLLDTVRRHDGSELPEVGLQAAATQLSGFFLTPEADKLLASNPKEYERRVSMLNRISAQLKGIQKYRDDCAKHLGYDYDPARIREHTGGELEKLRQDWSSTPGNSAKDLEMRHRNDLPKHGELLHIMPPPPPSMFPTFEEWKARRERDAKKAAEAQTQAQPTSPTAPESRAPERAKSELQGPEEPFGTQKNEVAG